MEILRPTPAARPKAASGAVILETLAVILVAFGGRIVLYGLGYESDGQAITARGLVAGAVSYVGWIFLVACLLANTETFDWKWPKSPADWLKELAWGALLLGASWPLELVVGSIAKESGLAGRPIPWTAALKNHETLLAFQAIAPLSALYQEVLCRVYVQTRLTQILRGRSFFVVIIASWLFAAMHGYGARQALAVFSFGALLGTSFQLNGRIPRIVFAHAGSLLLLGWIAGA